MSVESYLGGFHHERKHEAQRTWEEEAVDGRDTTIKVLSDQIVGLVQTLQKIKKCIDKYDRDADVFDMKEDIEMAIDDALETMSTSCPECTFTSL